MKIKCYHARRVTLVIDSEPQMFIQGPIIAPLIASITANDDYKLDTLGLEDIWDCCNNSCWWGSEFRNMTDYRGIFEVKFTNSYHGFCNDDLIVEANNKYYVAKSYGWVILNSFEEAFDYCAKNSEWCKIHSDKQHPIGKVCTIKELEEYRKEYEQQDFKCKMINT